MISTTKAHKYTLSLKKVTDSFGNEVNFNERLESKLIGEFNAYNILGIYAVAYLLGKERTKSAEGGLPDASLEAFREKIKEIIKKLDPAPGRFQAIKSSNNITGIVDYAHTPDALENVLKTINLMKDNHKIVSVVGCGGDRDRSKRPIMAKIGYDLSDILILTSDNPRTEKPEEILAEMHTGIENLPQNKVLIIVDRREAIEKACKLVVSGDYILVAGKGHENYQEINGIKTHFDDLEEIEKYLIN
jgi:UDP-N-acetylmuramoyl-L-alanyl-D-glutamate--2,6-diaminopimelate ligase